MINDMDTYLITSVMIITAVNGFLPLFRRWLHVSSELPHAHILHYDVYQSMNIPTRATLLAIAMALLSICWVF